MSGHSKWHKIHRQKGANDAKRGALFTKLGNAVTVAAKTGGGDPESNFRLRLAIEKARAANMTKDNIDKAIKRGTGELDGGPIEAVTYEGFGPEGIALMIECLTDNRNRTSSAIKHLLNKYGGNLGGPNTVAWMFEQRGVIRIPALTEPLELKLIDLGVQDIDRDDDGVIIYVEITNFQKVKDFLEEKKVEVQYAEIEWVPKEKKPIAENQKVTVEKLLELLDDDQDVNSYYTNAEI